MIDRLLRRFARAALAAALVIAIPARADSDLELRVKAAFLFNFARFATWPPAKLSSSQSSIYLCVLDPSPLGDALEDTVQGKSIDTHPVEVRRVKVVDELRACHIAYVGGGDAQKLEALLGHLAGAGVLSVHEADRALKSGVARFYLNDHRVRFELNLAAADQEQVQLSSRLQSVATIARQ